MAARLDGADRTLRFDDSSTPGNPNVWMFVGVNGVGKTTTIGKVANQQIDARSLAYCSLPATRFVRRPPSSSAPGPSGRAPTSSAAPKVATRRR